MTVAEITTDRFTAREAFREYRAALKRTHSAEDEALMKGYRALSRRQRVVDLYASMRAAGVDEQGRPRLAICRADAEMVWCRRSRDGSAEFRVQQWGSRANEAADRRRHIPPGTLPAILSGSSPIECRARVPLIPPRFRPDALLTNYFLLWEAEWVSVPVDPILLRHLGKNLYAVVAQWDLSELERAVLGAR